MNIHDGLLTSSRLLFQDWSSQFVPPPRKFTFSDCIEHGITTFFSVEYIHKTNSGCNKNQNEYHSEDFFVTPSASKRQVPHGKESTGHVYIGMPPPPHYDLLKKIGFPDHVFENENENEPSLDVSLSLSNFLEPKPFDPDIQLLISEYPILFQWFSIIINNLKKNVSEPSRFLFFIKQKEQEYFRILEYILSVYQTKYSTIQNVESLFSSFLDASVSTSIKNCIDENGSLSRIQTTVLDQAPLENYSPLLFLEMVKHIHPHALDTFFPFTFDIQNHSLQIVDTFQRIKNQMITWISTLGCTESTRKTMQQKIEKVKLYLPMKPNIISITKNSPTIHEIHFFINQNDSPSRIFTGPTCEADFLEWQKQVESLESLDFLEVPHPRQISLFEEHENPNEKKIQFLYQQTKKISRRIVKTIGWIKYIKNTRNGKRFSVSHRDMILFIMKHATEYKMKHVHSNEKSVYWPVPQWRSSCYKTSENAMYITMGSRERMMQTVKESGTMELNLLFTLGTIIGHELFHAIDEKGSYFDEHGRPRQEKKEKKEKNEKNEKKQLISFYSEIESDKQYFYHHWVEPVIQLYSQFSIRSGPEIVFLDATKTREENIADLVGFHLVHSILETQNINHLDSFYSIWKQWWYSNHPITNKDMTDCDHAPELFRYQGTMRSRNVFPFFICNK